MSLPQQNIKSSAPNREQSKRVQSNWWHSSSGSYLKGSKPRQCHPSYIRPYCPFEGPLLASHRAILTMFKNIFNVKTDTIYNMVVRFFILSISFLISHNKESDSSTQNWILFSVYSGYISFVWYLYVIIRYGCIHQFHIFA